MIRARVRLPRVNSPNFVLGITGSVQNVTLVILRHGSLALNKVRQSFRRVVAIIDNLLLFPLSLLVVAPVTITR
jgi:hypothetical protein